jgi:hypothetical protein
MNYAIDCHIRGGVRFLWQIGLAATVLCAGRMRWEVSFSAAVRRGPSDRCSALQSGDDIK